MTRDLRAMSRALRLPRPTGPMGIWSGARKGLFSNLTDNLTDLADASRIGRYAMKTDSSPALALGTRDRNETPTREIALWRIYLLRAGYLLIAVGMGMQKVPAFLHHKPWELMHGVVNSMLLALVLLAVLGLRYPLKMLPLLFWEIVWKATWLLAVALPAWRNHTMDKTRGTQLSLA